MRMDEIKEGLTYHNGHGLQRIVVQVPKNGKFGDVTYRKPGSEKTYSCYITTFCEWARGIVQGEEVSFSLKCSCSNTIEGYFSETDLEEILYCGCGKVWKIQRPTNK